MKDLKTEKKAVVLLSGGLDSSTVLALAGQQGFRCYCLSFDYGQRQRVELEKAKKIAEKAGAAGHLVLRIDLGRIGGSALTTEQEVPKGRGFAEMESSIPATYVPCRNTIFLSYAVSWAEVIGARHIFIGVNALDYSGYPDCRPEFLAAFERVANLGTRAGVESGEPFVIEAPLLRLSKKEIIERGTALGVDYSMTHTCYDPASLEEGGLACGLCDACRLRLKGFAEAGRRDPLPYRQAGAP